MCGIVGYIGSRDVSGVLVDGLKRLEYRGYDSCGVAIMEEGLPMLVRSVGRIAHLEQRLQQLVPFAGVNAGNYLRYGIGHTRWATHGRPSEDNAHPHRDCTGRFFVAHNGIIENYRALKERLMARGHNFITATDTEVLPHLIEMYFDGDLDRAVRRALRDVEGVFGIVVISPLGGGKIVAARKGAPLVLGLGAGENFIASDVCPLLPYTREVVFLKDGEMALVGSDDVELKDFEGRLTHRQAETITWTSDMAEKEGYPHFMLKEIHEQPRAIEDTIRERIDAAGNVMLEAEVETQSLQNVEKIDIVACGTSLHAGLIGKFLIERLARIPVHVDYASEFRYREPVIDTKDMVIGISQSGETADTLAGMKEGRARGAFLLSICNVVGSQAARLADTVIYTHAGPEIGVASTKAFTTQLAALYTLALQLAKQRETLSADEIRRHGLALKRLPDQMKQVLELNTFISRLAERLFRYPSFLYLGRGIQYPIAMEGALKLKEISYIHAEGYTAGEMKHGPIALIDQEMPVVVLAPKDSVYRKTMGNIEEVKVRNGIVTAVATDGDTEIIELADHTIFIPEADEFISPVLATVPLQLFAYYTALLRGCDVDKPRNLAKSVTVE
jgi:glucosamine--fructose-6-phosphate aminotransferase (isomerizing)